MSVTVADCLNLPSLRQGKVIAGAKGLGNPVNNISVIEITDPKFLISDKSINNCEISITSLYSVKDDIAAQCRVIEHLHNIGDVGMIIYYVGIVVKQIDKRLIELADSLDFPIIVMPENRDDFRYDEAIFEVTEALSRDRMNKLLPQAMCIVPNTFSSTRPLPIIWHSGLVPMPNSHTFLAVSSN